MFKHWITALGIIIASALTLPAQAQDAKNPVLVSYDGVKVTKSDVAKMIDFEVPENKRAEVWSNDKLLRQLIANLFVTRMLAKEGREEGLAKKQEWALNYLTDRNVMILALNERVRKKLAKVDFDELAKEYYQAHPDKFMRPEEVHAEHILISTQSRSDADAKKRAEMVLKKVKANPADFEKLAEKYSDDPSVKSNHGDLGFFSRKQMVPSFSKAAFALKEKGDISGLVKSRFGYHIIKLLGKRAAGKVPFAEVKDKLVAQQKEQLVKKYKQEAVEKVRAIKGIKTNQAAVDALVKAPADTKSGK